MVLGQEVSDEFTYESFAATGNSYEEFTDVQGVSGAVYAGKTAANNNTIQLRSTGSDCGIVTTTSGGNRVKSIIVEWNSNTSTSRQLDVYGKTSAYSSAADLYNSTTIATRGEDLGSIPYGTTELIIEGDYTYVGIRSNSGALYLDKLTIVWEQGEQTQVSAPVFSPVSGTDFTDQLTVTATCSTDGAVIYYTTDGSDPTTASAEFPAEGLDITETTTFKAMAAVADGSLENSAVVEAVYTKVEPYASLAALKASGIATTGGTECFVQLDNAVVTYAESGKAYIQDGTAGLYIYGSNSLQAGTSLNGVVQAKLALYYGLYELVVSGGEFDGVEVMEGVDIPVQTLTLAELTADFDKYESMRVKVENATVTSAFANRNGAIEQDGTTMALRAATTDIQVDVDAVVNVVGYPGLYNTTQQLNVNLQEDIEELQAGKATATVSFEQSAYSVNVGETLTVAAATNSTAGIVYTSENPEVATVDATTGLVTGIAAGSTLITASVAENDEYTAASASYTLTVVDPAALPEAVAFVAMKDGNYFAMTTTEHSSGERLVALQVAVLNGNVVSTGDKTSISWYVDEEAGTIQTASGEYLSGVESGTNLRLAAEPCTWTWNAEDNYWAIGNRSFIYTTGNDGIFRNYAVSNLGTGTYADTYTVAMPIVDGYTRSVTTGNYGTICLPYAVAADDMAGADFFSIAGKVLGSDGNAESIVLNTVTELEAGMPYIFCATSDTLAVAFSGEAVTEAGQSNGLIGTLVGQDVDEGMYMLTDNIVQLCGTGCSIGANRAYIDMTQVPVYSEAVGVNQLLLDVSGGTTGIGSTVSDTADTPVDVYTLSGVKVRHQVRAAEATEGLQRGIYIVNGKKVIVK